MTIFRPFLPALLCASTLTAHAQSGAHRFWYFGYRAGLDMSTASPAALTDGMMETAEGCTARCDSLGNLLFYTDGTTVWDRTHTPMMNGTGLFGNVSSTQAALVVPFHGDPLRYYLFTTPAQMSIGIGGWGGAAYSIIDMAGNSGLGAVTVKNVLLADMVTEKLAATRHANGRDTWVLMHGWDNNVYHAYLVTCAGILGPVDSAVGQTVTYAALGDTGPARGCLQFNAQGTRVAGVWGVFVDDNNSYARMEMLRFDNATGVLSDPVGVLHEQPGQHVYGYGTAFSASGDRLYVSEYTTMGAHILQYDTSVPDLASTEVKVAESNTPYGTMQRTADGRIYVARLNGADFLGRINAPEVPGTGCNVEEQAVLLAGRYSTWGLPNHWDVDAPTTRPDLELRDTTVCGGGSVVLDATVEHPFFLPTYLWSAGATAAAITVEAEGHYSVRVVLGCDTLWADADVTIQGVPLDLGPDALLCTGDSLHLVVPAEAAEWAWSSGDTTRTLTVGGEGIWILVVADAEGCLTSDTLRISSYDCTCPVYLPNTFTPNADDHNDRFGARTACPLSGYDLRLYDRWGQAVWSGTDSTEGWDGTTGGAPVPEGVFAWTLQVRWWDGQGERSRSERGHVLVLR